MIFIQQVGGLVYGNEVVILGYNERTTRKSRKLCKYDSN